MTDASSPSQQGLVLDQVSLKLGTTTLLDITAAIAPGTVLTVMGESGSGKSSLLDYIAGFLKPDFTASGRIFLNGRDITDLRAQDRHIGLMFQSPLLFPHLSVVQNLTFAIPSQVKSRSERRRRAEDALDDIGLAGFGGRDPAKLSGGQQTRVALMRTLLAEPQALLLDEPFSSLDRNRRADVRELVLSTARSRGLPVVLVTHDAEDAEATAGPVLRIDSSSDTL